MNLLEIIRENSILAILRNVPTDDATNYAETIVNGGISFFEVALNSKDALLQISMLRKHFGERALIGAGTAISIDLVKQAAEAGAQFFLTPGTPLSVLEYCAKKNYALLPGVYTPSEIATSLDYGFKVMKFFPAANTPTGYLKAMSGPFDNAKYVAIGGVTPDNINEYFSEGYFGVGIASNLLPPQILQEKKWEEGSEYIKGFLGKVDYNLIKN